MRFLLLLLLAASAHAEPAIQLFGDSTQVQAAPLLAERFGDRIEVRAVGGTRSDMLLNGTDGLNQPWPRSVRAGVVVINHGMNDARPWVKVPVDVYAANLRRLVAGARGARVVLETPNPSTYPGRDTTPYAAVMRAIAAELGLQVIDTHSCFQTLPDWQKALYDGVHPDARGLRHIVDVCKGPAIAALLERYGAGLTAVASPQR